MTAKKQVPWWIDDANAGPLNERLCTAATLAWKDDAPRRRRHEDFARIYLNRNIGGLAPDQYNVFNEREFETIRIQITRTMIDAVQARIAKNRPKPTALTKRGDQQLQDQAKRIDAFIWGVFQREGAYKKGPTAFRNAMVFADGLTKVTPVVEHADNPKKRTGRIRFDNVPPWEVFCDALEAYYGEPRSLYQIHQVDRGVLKEIFPLMKGRLSAASRQPILDYGSGKGQDGVLNDRMQVLEAWHLPSGPGASDGKHILTTKDLVLTPKDEQGWDHDRFPFSRISWSGDLPAGFWSQGMIETSRSIQKEINELAAKIQAGMFYNSRPVILVEENSDVEEGDIDNALKGTIIKYSGQPPIFNAPQALNQEVYAHMDRLVQLAMNLEGVSELSVASRKPAGLQSGKALLDFNDIESERFILRGQSYEEYHLDLGRLTVMTARDLHKMDVPVEVTAEKRRFRKRYVDKIKWSEINIEDDQFELSLMPSSSLPHTPAGKRQAVESMFEVGFITRDQALELMEMPDTDAVLSRELAKVELPLFQLSSILEDGKLVAPVPMQPLEDTLAVANATFMRAMVDEVSPKKLDLLQQFIDAIMELLAKAEQAEMEKAAAIAAAQNPQPAPAPAPAPGPNGAGAPPADALGGAATPPPIG